jgi:arginase family enzyme
MTANVVVFPFDLFGSGGAGDGATLLADALREAVDDTAAEDRPTRPHAFADRLAFEEHPFETLADVAGWRETGRAAARRLLADADFGLWLAGNHLGVLPVYESLTAADLVVQFDAHLDCYDLHDTQNELCHGNFLLHAEPEGGAGPKVVNVGHRDLFLLPKDVKRAFAKTHPAEAVFADPAGVAADLRKRAKAAKRVWIDVDADVFDPAYCPAVAEPLPFGLTPQLFLPLLDAAWAGNVAGFSVSEFAPGRDVRDTSLNLLGWLLERVLLKRFEA